MKTYVVTGGTTGIGAAIRKQLLARGDHVINVDIRGGEITVDLATVEGRQHAVEQIRLLAPEGIDGFVPCAGLGPQFPDLQIVIAVNYFAVRKMTELLRSLLVKKRGAVVLVSSNSAALPGMNEHLVTAMLNDNDELRARNLVSRLDGFQAYGCSKNALTRWMRRVAPSWAGDGVRINAVAPGATMTPLLDAGLRDPVWGDAIRNFKVPMGDFGRPEQIADAIAFLLSEQSSFCAGTVLFVDGGTDALLRPDSF